MRYRVELSDKAEADVDAVLRWFHDQQQAVDAGARWLAELMYKLDALESEPGRCPLAIEAGDVEEEIHELLFGRRRYKYRILFKISGKVVSILRIWHSSRDSVTRRELLE